MTRTEPGSRQDYRFFIEIPTRWLDNDTYSHINNVYFFSYFDTVIARFLLDRGGFDYQKDEIIGYAVNSGCQYFEPIMFPDLVHAGLRMGHIGNRSARYEIGIFKNDGQKACAEGHFTHVFVDRKTETPASIPPKIKEAMQAIAAS